MMTKVPEEIHPHRPDGKALEYFEGLRCLYRHGAQTSRPRSRDFWQPATHGVPGVLKNALDWVVGSSELVGKPVALINTSARATHAWNSLVETFTVMSARVILGASITVPLQGKTLDADGIAGDPELATLLRCAVDALATATLDRSAV